MRRAIWTIAALALVGQFAGAEEPPEEAELAFNNHCRTCHTREEGDHRLGPSLHDLIGRKAGSAEGYTYSSAFQQEDFTWDAETLDAFIADPDAVVPGNAMKPYTGVRDEAARAAIIEALGGEPRDD